MSANHKRLLALALWAELVLVLASWKWWPRPVDTGDLHPEERAFILRLPQDVLTGMIDQGVMVSLAIPEPPKPPEAQPPATKSVPAVPAKATVPGKAASPKKEKRPKTLAPVTPAPPSTSVVEHSRVLSKVCKVEIQSTARVAACYAVIAVPKDRIAALASAGDKVSVWIEGK